MSDGQKRKPAGRNIAVIEAELREDAETQKIADTLGLPLDDYIAMVMEYVKDPNKEAQLEIYSEEELEMATGEKPATIAEIDDWLDQVESGEVRLGPVEVGQTIDFDDDETATEARALKAAGKNRTVSAPKEGEKKSEVFTEDNEAGHVLRDHLLKEAQNARTMRRGPRKKPKPNK